MLELIPFPHRRCSIRLSFCCFRSGIARVDRDHAGGVVLGLRAELSGRRDRVRVWMAAQTRRDADPGDCLRRCDDDRGKRRIRIASSAWHRCSCPNSRRLRLGLPPMATGTSVPADDFGFPSGHVATTAAWALGLAWSRRKPWQLGAAATWIALMALSRMYPGTPFPGGRDRRPRRRCRGAGHRTSGASSDCRGHQHTHGRLQKGTGRVAPRRGRTRRAVRRRTRRS